MGSFTHVLVRERGTDDNGRQYEKLRIADVWLDKEYEPNAMGPPVDVVVYAELNVPEPAEFEKPEDRAPIDLASLGYLPVDLPTSREQLRAHLSRLLRALDKPAYDYYPNAPDKKFVKIDEE